MTEPHQGKPKGTPKKQGFKKPASSDSLPTAGGNRSLERGWGKDKADTARKPHR